MDPKESADASALRLAGVLKRVRPELDLYLLSNGQVEEIAGNPKANVMRRIFYAVEELLELHLAILEGVQDRYDTPFFNDLKKYAQRPIGTFHALPIARGKSIFESDWIRDIGEFYGLHLFWLEEQRHHSGIGRPAGADQPDIKKGRDAQAHCVRRRSRLLRHQWHLDVNEMAVQALLAPGDIAIVDRNCHGCRRYPMVLAGTQPAVRRGVSR